MEERIIHIYVEGGSCSNDAEGTGTGTGLFLCGENDTEDCNGSGELEHNEYKNPLRIEANQRRVEVLCTRCVEILGPLKQLAAMEL